MAIRTLVISSVLFISLAVLADALCYIDIPTCACDTDLPGGPGTYTVCHNGSTCPANVLVCESGTKCGLDYAGEAECRFNDQFGLCYLHSGVCLGHGLCGISLVIHHQYHPFYGATGGPCPKRDN